MPHMSWPLCGIHRAFDSQQAQFTRIVESPFYIAQIFQKAHIEVTESTTKAAAVIVIGMEASSVPAPEPAPIAFTADHPFLHFITERSTGTIYFMGTYCGD